MPDGLVEVRLSVQMAEAVRAFEYVQKKGIGGMVEELRRAKGGATAFGRAAKDATDPWKVGLSQINAQRDKWAAGMATISVANAKQRAENAAAAAAATRHWQQQIAVAEASKKVTEETRAQQLEYGKSADAGSNMATKVIAGFSGMLAGAVSLSKAIGLIKSEYDAMVARGKAAAGFQVTLAGAQRAMIRNLSGSELSVQQADKKVKDIVANTGADQTAVTSAASSALSARGNISEKKALETVGATAKMDASFAGDELATVAGASLDMQKAFGGSPEQALGAMLTSQQTARVVTAQDFSANVVPGLMGLAAFGDSYREASALVSTISQQSADASGQRSGTAAIRFAQQLADKTAGVKALEGKGTEARRQWLLSGEKDAESARRELLGTMLRDYDESETREAAESDPSRKAELHGEAKQYMAMLQLLEPDSPTARAYQETFAATPEYQQAGGRYAQNIADQRKLGLQATARQAEIARAALQTELNEESRAAVSQTRTGLQDVLEQAGAFGRSGAVETGAFSDLAAIEAGSAPAKKGISYHGVRRLEDEHDSPAIRAINAALRVVRLRLANAKKSGQLDKPEWAATRKGLEDYVKAQTSERDKLANDWAEAHASQLFVPGTNRQPEEQMSVPAPDNAAARGRRLESVRQLLKEDADKRQQKVDKKTDAAQKKLDAAAAAQTKRLAAQRDSLGKQVAEARKTVEADDRRLDELRTEAQAQQAINRTASQERASRPAPSPFTNPKRKRGSAPKGPSAATQQRNAEAERRKQVAIDDAERKRQADADKLNSLIERQNKLLETIAANTSNPQVTVRNAGDPARDSRRASPPAPVIGGN